MHTSLPGLRLTELVRAGEGTEFIALSLGDAREGVAIELDGRGERLAVIMSGRARVVIDGREVGTAGGRGDVFDGPGDAVYLPAGLAGSLTALGGDLSVAIASAPPSQRPGGRARILPAAEQRVVSAGRDTFRREVRTILGPADPASRLLAGETVNPPGLWSSYPPHRHDRASAEEVRLEEVYLFRVRPANGFGVQIRYDSDGEREARVVRDREVAVITSGFHPVVTTPGHHLYYLWVMAGEGRELRPYIDPRYRWVEAER